MGTTIVIEFVIKYFYWAFLGWIFMTLIQRRHGNKGIKKRMAVLYQAIIIFLIMVYATILKMNELTDVYMIIAVIAVVMVLFFYRKKILPYQFTCRVCGKRMTFERIFYYDDPLCKEHDKEEIEIIEEVKKKIEENESEDD
ncbi:MAG: hypothetical protein PF518_15675 [Spirochaetaceae bacterium]|jgi:nicotinamide riboside transporter PnuC|nr:hypothetical protein [Spirochaetaceae bacterium]